MRDPVVALIAEQRAALLSLLSGVAGAKWLGPTVCTGWSIQDLLAHLVEGELNVGRIYRGEVKEQGPIDPEEGVAKWRPLPGEAVRAALWQHGVATQRVLEAMTDEGWRAPIKAFGCREVRQLVRLHLFDVAVHGHDLTDALGSPPVWEPCLPFLVEFVVRAAPGTFARLRVPPEGALAVKVPDHGRSWVLIGEGPAWTLRAEESRAPSTLSLSPEDLVLVTTGRRPVTEVLGRAAVQGDRALVERVLSAWRVV